MITGRLEVHAHRAPTGRPRFAPPQVTLDGFPAQSTWGLNPYDIPAGRHRVRVAVRYFGEIGAAELDVDVVPGQTTVLHYSQPVFVFQDGRLAPTRQRHPGQTALWACFAVIVTLLVVGLVGRALGS